MAASIRNLMLADTRNEIKLAMKEVAIELARTAHNQTRIQAYDAKKEMYQAQRDAIDAKVNVAEAMREGSTGNELQLLVNLANSKVAELLEATRTCAVVEKKNNAAARCYDRAFDELQVAQVDRNISTRKLSDAINNLP